MNGRGIASFLAGMGTGYFNSEKDRKDRERQDRRDKIDADRAALDQKRLQQDIDATAEAQTKEVNMKTGLDEASQMKVGQLRDQSGTVDISAQGFQSRLEANGVDPTVAANAAPIYANSAKQKGSESWLANSFGNPAAGGIGDAKETTKGDIKRKQADALAAGGKYDQSITMKDQAEALDIKDLKGKLLSAKTFDEVDKLYDIVPDGFKIKSEVSKEDGRLRYWYEDADGNKTMPASNLPQDFADFNEFKTMAANYVEQNPEYISAAWDKAHGRKTADIKEAREVKKSDLDIKAGELNIKGAESDLKVKQKTETQRIVGAGLDNQIKQATIANTYDEIAKRKSKDAKDTTEAEYKANEEKRKNGDQYRQDFATATASFDKSFKRDRMGNLIGDELNSKHYSDAANVIGMELKKGASIDDAQAIGRLVYDEALSGGVSVKTAYKVIQDRLANAKKEPKKDNAIGSAPTGGASAVKDFLNH